MSKKGWSRSSMLCDTAQVWRPGAYSRARVIGVGTAWRRDDGLGLHMLSRLQALAPGGLQLLAHDGEPVSFLELLSGAGRVWIVDALQTGTPPGTIRRLDLPEDARPAGWTSCSSHGMGIAAAVALGRVLGMLPPALVLYGAERNDTGFCRAMTPAVRSAGRRIAERIVDEWTTATET